MERFEIYILGCGSALPTTKHFLSSQVINLRDKLYMIDCGEGAQLQFRAMKQNFQKLSRIFISHLHGDHCFGLPGLISTLGLLGRTADLHIHAHYDAEKLFAPLFRYFCKELPYKIYFQAFNPEKSELIFEDRSLKVTTIPLKHRVPTAGFLFEEKPSSPHIIREMIDFYRVPVSQIRAIKEGAPFITGEGETIPSMVFTRPAETPRKYAYCSDTAYYEKIIPIIADVNTLYHEATFSNADCARAKETFHSSAAQAASIAKAANAGRLVIGHFSARYPDERILLNEALEIFPKTQLAYEKMILKV
ncbi:MAG: ribonuclease Z [Dysgonamonadaceae bacterium]|nr:ribonuclease Z [Dysgonamonadaceae bacterium]